MTGAVGVGVGMVGDIGGTAEDGLLENDADRRLECREMTEEDVGAVTGMGVFGDEGAVSARVCITVGVSVVFDDESFFLLNNFPNIFLAPVGAGPTGTGSAGVNDMVGLCDCCESSPASETDIADEVGVWPCSGVSGRLEGWPGWR
jgi:hypothetical protein